MRNYRWLEALIAVLIIVIIAVMVHGWATCSGSYVRTMFWFKCIP